MPAREVEDPQALQVYNAIMESLQEAVEEGGLNLEQFGTMTMLGASWESLPPGSRKLMSAVAKRLRKKGVLRA